MDQETTEPYERLEMRRRQQAILAEFGQFAIEAENIDDVLDEAARRSAQGLAVRLAKVLQWRPDRHDLLVRSGCGWDDDVVGVATIPAGLDSPAGYALYTGKPVIANRLDREQRFQIPDLLRRHGVITMVNVLIATRDEPFGILEVDSPDGRQFSDDDVNFISGMASLVGAVLTRQRAYDQLKDTVQQNAALLRELEHRVKNNLQIVSSLLNMQVRGVADPESKRQLEVVRGRIDSLRFVHQQLHTSGNAGRLDFSEYLRSMCGSLGRLGRGAERIVLELAVAPAPIAIDIATPLGLIVNEFISSSLLHSEDDGCIRVRLARLDEGNLELVLSDGAGLQREAEVSGLGHRLIEMLAAQIHADLQWNGDDEEYLVLRFAGLS